MLSPSDILLLSAINILVDLTNFLSFPLSLSYIIMQSNKLKSNNIKPNAEYLKFVTYIMRSIRNIVSKYSSNILIVRKYI